MKKGIIRQGDVLLVPCKGVRPPSDARNASDVVLAEGEITGHAHRVKADVVLDWEVEGQRYIRVSGRQMGSLWHEDHDPHGATVVKPETTYRVVPQREYSLENQWRRVVD